MYYTPPVPSSKTGIIILGVIIVVIIIVIIIVAIIASGSKTTPSIPPGGGTTNPSSNSPATAMTKNASSLIVSKLNSLCVTPFNSQLGVQLIGYTCETVANCVASAPCNELFKYDDKDRLVGTKTGFCLKENGTEIVNATCDETDLQKWTITSTDGPIKTKSGKCMTYGVGIYNGIPLIGLSTCDNSSKQSWTIKTS